MSEKYEHPEELYNRQGELTEAERLHLFDFEEMMVGLLHRTSHQIVSEDRIEELAMSVDSLMAGQASIEGVSEEDYSALQRLLYATESMGRGELRPLPAVLKSVVDRDIEMSKKADQKQGAEGLPTIIVSLVEEGVRVIKSTLKGVELLPIEASVTRSAPSLAEAGSGVNRIDMIQRVESKNSEVAFHYQVLRESDQSLMLNISFEEPQAYRRASLLQDGRLVDSRIVGQNEKQISFGNLMAGDYRIELSGDGADHGISLVVANETSR